MIQESKEAEQGTLVVVEAVWHVVRRGQVQRRQSSRWVDVSRMLQQVLGRYCTALTRDKNTRDEIWHKRRHV